MEKISVRYKDLIVDMLKKSRRSTVVTEDDVLQEGNVETLFYINKIVEENLDEHSRLIGREHIQELYQRSQKGESCLFLLEHFSNLDLPVLAWLIRSTMENGDAIADSILAIAGVKLNESNPVVTAFAESFSRIVIAPSRTLAKLNPETEMDELKRLTKINRASMRALNKTKKSGRIVLVFPQGTRFRPWEPELTKRGVREIDSYIKSFDNMCLVSINGMILHMQKGRMEEDLVGPGTVIMEASPVIRCNEFRSRVKKEVKEGEDLKQAVVDAVMAELEKMHEKNENLQN